MKVKSGLKQFMNGIIDYAGMFPPAKLDFYSAFQNYLFYQNHRDGWMVDRFVFPIKMYERLPEFEDFFKEQEYEIKLTTLPRYHDSSDLFLSDFMTDLISLGSTIFNLSASFDFRVFEFKLPKDLMHASQNEFNEFFNQLIQFAKDHPLTNPRFFVEMHITDDWKFQMNKITDMIKHHPYAEHLGFKLRCGGITADLFPDSEIVATAIHLCNEKNIPVKFTAGLHHLIRHYNEDVSTKMYGFFNVFGACMLSKRFHIDINQIEDILVDEKPENFAFSDLGMKWKDMEVPTSVINQSRNTFCMSYGSCSFEEPRDDLKHLHLI